MTERALRALVRRLPAERAEWGEAMLAEGSRLEGVARVRWAVGIAVALVPWLLGSRHSRILASGAVGAFLLALPPIWSSGFYVASFFMWVGVLWHIGTRYRRNPEAFEGARLDELACAVAAGVGWIWIVRLLSLDAPIRSDPLLPYVFYATAAICLAGAVLSARARCAR